MLCTSSSPASLKDYLKKYTSNDDEKKKKRKVKPDFAGVLVVDEDPVWQNRDGDEEDSSDEDIEIKRMRRLEHIRSRRPFGAISEGQNADISPPRKRNVNNDGSSSIASSKTGLVSGKDVNIEIDKTRKDEWLRFDKMDPSVSGRNAEPVYRHKITGERISKEEFLKSLKKELKKELKPKEIKLEWGKGLAQKREAESRLQEMEAEKERPFARSRDDVDLDKMLKERVRWGDPMPHLVKKKKHLEAVLVDLGDNEKMKESGFVIPQEIPNHSWINRGLAAAQNRYGIKPGRHWDGVDRTTGYEKEMFKRKNEKGATHKEAYLWSVSDM